MARMGLRSRIGEHFRFRGVNASIGKLMSTTDVIIVTVGEQANQSAVRQRRDPRRQRRDPVPVSINSDAVDPTTSQMLHPSNGSICGSRIRTVPFSNMVVSNHWSGCIRIALGMRAGPWPSQTDAPSTSYPNVASNAQRFLYGVVARGI